MRLSRTQLRRIINEEADAVDAAAPEAEAPAPDAAPAPAAAPADPGAEAISQLPEASEDANDVVESLGLTSVPDGPEGESTGSALAKFLTFVEMNAEGSLAKLSEPVNVARMIQAMSDYLTLEILEITQVQIEGMPSREEFKQRLTGGGGA